MSCRDNYGGYIAFTDGKWIYSASDSDYEWGSNNTVTIRAVVIDSAELVRDMCETNLVKYIEY